MRLVNPRESKRALAGRSPAYRAVYLTVRGTGSELHSRVVWHAGRRHTVVVDWRAATRYHLPDYRFAVRGIRVVLRRRKHEAD